MNSKQKIVTLAATLVQSLMLYSSQSATRLIRDGSAVPDISPRWRLEELTLRTELPENFFWLEL